MKFFKLNLKTDTSPSVILLEKFSEVNDFFDSQVATQLTSTDSYMEVV